jgi:hypothetical protein
MIPLIRHAFVREHETYRRSEITDPSQRTGQNLREGLFCAGPDGGASAFGSEPGAAGGIAPIIRLAAAAHLISPSPDMALPPT